MPWRPVPGTRGRLALVLVTLLTGFAAASARAEQTRCIALGPLALSGHTRVLLAVASGSRETVFVETEKARTVLGYYRDLGCPMKPLFDSMECIASEVRKPRNKGKSIPMLTEKCMKNSGMPTR